MNLPGIRGTRTGPLDMQFSNLQSPKLSSSSWDLLPHHMSKEWLHWICGDHGSRPRSFEVHQGHFPEGWGREASARPTKGPWWMVQAGPMGTGGYECGAVIRCDMISLNKMELRSQFWVSYVTQHFHLILFEDQRIQLSKVITFSITGDDGVLLLRRWDEDGSGELEFEEQRGANKHRIT